MCARDCVERAFYKHIVFRNNARLYKHIPCDVFSVLCGCDYVCKPALRAFSRVCSHAEHVFYAVFCAHAYNVFYEHYDDAFLYTHS